jgi:hypothetical protein
MDNCSGQSILTYDSPIPVRALFGNTRLCAVININDAEAQGVAKRPFEVIQEGPDEVSPEINALLNGSRGSPEMRIEIGNTFHVIALAFGINVIVERHTIFGDKQWKRRIFLLHADQQLR